MQFAIYFPVHYMNNTFTSRSGYAGLLLMLSIVSSPLAAEEAAGIFLYPHSGLTTFDDGSELGLDRLKGLAIGYRFHGPLALELVLQNADPDSDDATSGDVDIDSWRLNTRYHFDTDMLGEERKLQPFMTLGLGRVNYDFITAPDIKETQFSFGAGLKWNWTPQASLRSDITAVYGNREDSINTIFSVGVQYVFKSKGWHSVAAVKPTSSQPSVVAAPVEVPTAAPVEEPAVASVEEPAVAPETPVRAPDPDLVASVRLNVLFDFNSYAARTEHAAEIQKVAQFMGVYPETSVTMEGHTDSIGSEAYNQVLSEQRARTIADMLIEQFGIAASRVNARGFGELEPIDTNSTESGRQHNRRVTAEVTAK